MRAQLFQDAMSRRHLTGNETDFANEIFWLEILTQFLENLQEKFEKKKGDAK